MYINKLTELITYEFVGKFQISFDKTIPTGITKILKHVFICTRSRRVMLLGVQQLERLSQTLRKQC